MKTAVQFLIEKLSNYDLEMISLFKDEINQALEKEKEQIVEAYLTGADYTNDEEVILAIEYYKETYNQNK